MEGYNIYDSVILAPEGVKCQAATAPVSILDKKIFNSTLDGTTATIIGPVTSGNAAYFGGIFENKGCEDLILEITYLQGGDCEPCNDADTLSTVVVPWVIPANTKEKIPAGFWTQISYTLENAANDAKIQKVLFKSSYTPECPECIVLAP